jgi:sugar lactone lactonase YvrE
MNAANAAPWGELRGNCECVWDAGATLGEGTYWSSLSQALWWVDILECRLHRWEPAQRQRRTWQFDEEVSAVAERRDRGGLIVTLRRGFASFDPDAARDVPRYLCRPVEEPAGNRFNDGKCDRQGRFWGGTMDFACVARSGALYRYDPSGVCVRHAVGFAVTNGPTWSLDQGTLYLNDTVNGQVHAFDFEAGTGALSRQRVWLSFAAGDGVPDGMTTDALGRIWIAHWGGACVSCHDPRDGAELGRVEVPTRHVTNCTFGGPQLRTLFITTARSGLSQRDLQAEPLAGGLFAVEVATPGLPDALFGA